MRMSMVCLILFLLAAPAAAQLRPDDGVNRVVAQVTEAWFDQLPKADFATERAFFAPSLAGQVSKTEWSALRQQMIDRIGGATPRYRARALSYYPRETLYAAVDFSARTEPAGVAVCGYVVWSLPDASTIGLIRMEENIVDPAIFQKMPAADAWKMLAEWRCPAPMIQEILTP